VFQQNFSFQTLTVLMLLPEQWSAQPQFLLRKAIRTNALDARERFSRPKRCNQIEESFTKTASSVLTVKELWILPSFSTDFRFQHISLSGGELLKMRLLDSHLLDTFGSKSIARHKYYQLLESS
jgi:hypothetical protein